MKLVKSFLIVLVIVSVFFYIIGSKESKIDPKYYRGESISTEWDVRSVCQTTRAIIKNRFINRKADSLYSSACTVSKVSAPLPGKFSHYEPYAVSWSNGVTARVFITSNGLKVAGISESGIPESWN